MSPPKRLSTTGWKWWKKQTIDLPQVQMELVDILHFSTCRTPSSKPTGQQADGCARAGMADLATPALVTLDGKTYSLGATTMAQPACVGKHARTAARYVPASSRLVIGFGARPGWKRPARYAAHAPAPRYRHRCPAAGGGGHPEQGLANLRDMPGGAGIVRQAKARVVD